MSSIRIPLLVIALLSLALPAAADTLVELGQPALIELQSAGFELTRAGTVRVEAVGRESGRDENRWSWSWGGKSMFGEGDDGDLLVYAWILDVETREPVWVMDPDETERAGGSRELRREIVDLELEAGRYEVYLYSGHHRFSDRLDWDDQGRDFRRARKEAEEDLPECFVRLSSDDISKSAVRTFEAGTGRPEALIAFTEVGDGQMMRQGFALSRESKLHVYGLMEYPTSSDDAADFGWIVDLDGGNRVWDMNDRRGRRAGGSSKNRLIDRDIRLDAGRYMLVYGTDDSHSYTEFNSNPPFDPTAWGIQLFAADDAARSAFSRIEIPERGEVLIDFSRARDRDFYEQPFRLAKDVTLHVYAIGEGVDDGWTFVDYGWITDAATGETVWEMDDRNTHPAGGAEKNRLFDGSVRLPAGDYVAYYTTDDSHSYGDWNSGAPFDPEAWGMQIFAGEGMRASDLTKLDASDVHKAIGVLADLTRVRDDEREREKFEITEPTDVEIYAVGEGIDGDMYDYGWLRNLDTRRIVWEMDYRDTDHAGGANKNRMVRAHVTLEPGHYEAVFETDGSHSFEDWNDRRPHDPLSWGMVVRKVD